MFGRERSAAAAYHCAARRCRTAGPAEIVAGDVQLSVAQVWLALDSGRLDEAVAALEAAEQFAPRDAHLRLLRALHTYKTGDVKTAAGLLDDGQNGGGSGSSSADWSRG